MPDLLAALDSGRIAEAVLDVTGPESLPRRHRPWSHERVRGAPQIASLTQPDTAARVVLDSLRCYARGEAPLGLVDRERSYG